MTFDQANLGNARILRTYGTFTPLQMPKATVYPLSLGREGRGGEGRDARGGDENLRGGARKVFLYIKVNEKIYLLFLPRRHNFWA